MRPIFTNRVEWSVGLSVCHASEPCKNCCTNRDAVWIGDSGWSKEPCIRWESRSPIGGGNFEGERGAPIAACGAGAPFPSFSRLCPFTSPIFCSFFTFAIFLFSFILPIFFRPSCPLFYPSSATPFPGRRS